MPIKVAFAGFRHGHIYGLVKLAEDRKDTKLVASCEEHAETREAVNKAGRVAVKYDNFGRMLDETDCDVVAIGDYYGRRGALCIEAMRRGKHVIADKPLCTDLAELDQIERLAREKRLAVGCMLDLRAIANFRTMRRVVLGGDIGDVCAVSFTGQHPLNYGGRPSWYFEEGKHGGTINDIAIHGIDAVPWMTGRTFVRINCARTWHMRPPQVPHFRDGAQLMMELDNGAGVMGDVSYFTPDSQGYGVPQYWRTTVWGSDGVVECNCPTADSVMLYRNGEKQGRAVELSEGRPGCYFDSFLKEIRGEKENLDITSAEVLRSARTTLMVQHAADGGQFDVVL